MPFVSKKQQRKCYALKAQGKGGKWDCAEFSKHTDFTELPEKLAAGATPHTAPIKQLKPMPGLFQPTAQPNSPQSGNRPAGTRPDGQPIVRSAQERTAKPAQASLGDGPLTNGNYGAYGMRTPWLNGVAAPPTVANNGGQLKMALAEQLGKLAACAVKKRHRIVRGNGGKFVYQGRSAVQLKDDPQYKKHLKE
ncbi:hypothetical protein E6Q11_06820 [Candidatus Dojkabacteria bacterium]|uniref:Uncharacterized protein n=1 Tax=Candidatus Dojkabacteria bacterium TaxID=2099670 RepID=A0A5C7J2N3_9BACT|nr:MAG: hypothetical protein E6Q11_06820 [Candidatus Dojkabacteria bacterium]